MKRSLFLFFLLAGLSCSGILEPVPATPDPPKVVEITAPPADLQLDSFYQKYVDAMGIPIVSSHKVPDEVLLKVRNLTLFLFNKTADHRFRYIHYEGKIAVIATSEAITEIPENSGLYGEQPDINWNEEVRGLGATLTRPVTTIAAENVICSEQDIFQGEDLFVREMAKGMLELSFKWLYTTFEERLNDLYNDALEKGLWENTLAAGSPEDYFGEGVQAFYNVNQESEIPDGKHNSVDTRSELSEYDPGLFELIRRYLPELGEIPSCHLE